MKKVFIILCFLSLVGCTPRGCQRLDRSFQFSERNYVVKQYSGDSLMNTYKFHGILNPEEHSDGYFWIQNDTLYEVSGTLEIKSWD